LAEGADLPKRDSRGPSKRAPFDELRALATAVSTNGGVGPTSRAEELCDFLEALTPRARTQVVARMVRLPRAEQARVHRVVVEHAYWLSSDGPAGPGAALLQELREALNAQVDSLPDPGPTGLPSRTAEEWRASHASHMAAVLVQSGWPDEIGRAAAEDLTRLEGPARRIEQWTKELMTAGVAAEDAAAAAQGAHDLGRFYAELAQESGRHLDDVMRDDLIKSGMSPEAADALNADWRRNRKWLAASDAALPAKLLADRRTVEAALRKECPNIARHANAIATALAALAVQTAPDRVAAGLRDGTMGKLIAAISAAIPQSPTVFELVQKGHPSAKGSPYQWYEAASATDELVNSIAEGGTPDRAVVAAREVKVIADEARTWADALSRGRGRPRKPSVDAAVALKAKGLKPAQMAMVLDRHGLKLDGNIPAEAARQAAKTRRRRSGTK
jgi:hypothetical protein